MKLQRLQRLALFNMTYLMQDTPNMSLETLLGVLPLDLLAKHETVWSQLKSQMGWSMLHVWSQRAPNTLRWDSHGGLVLVIYVWTHTDWYNMETFHEYIIFSLVGWCMTSVELSRQGRYQEEAVIQNVLYLTLGHHSRHNHWINTLCVIQHLFHRSSILNLVAVSVKDLKNFLQLRLFLFQ